MTFRDPMHDFPDSVWPRFIAAGNLSTDHKIKEINPEQPNHIIDNLFDSDCEGFWKSYLI